ncbi:MAG: 3-hydroxyacyl-ACP dehydratase FabZ [Clostridiales bacterium]|nr:3-hydroxyacyl-ACP dehydratase FabZ [Clostridiales bacterium]
MENVILTDELIEVTGLKNVTINEPFFQGHFPGNPIMPGVLIVEALAQTGGIAAALVEENKDKLGVFTGIESFKFRRQVVPGDTLQLEAHIIALRRGLAKVSVKATVEGQIAAEGEIKFAMVDVKK